MSAEGYLRSILDELRIKPRGEVYPMKFTLAANSPMLTIDFLDGTARLGAPNNVFTQNLVIPQSKLFSVQIKNYGPGSLHFATNVPISSADAEAPMDVMETITLDFTKTVVERINLLAVGGATTVRLICLV